MYRLWTQGIEVVEGVKRERGTESAAHRTAARWFYGLISKAAKTDLRSSSDFKLLDRKAVLVLLNLPERDTFYRALSAWVGFRTARVEFDVQHALPGRAAGLPSASSATPFPAWRPSRRPRSTSSS